MKISDRTAIFSRLLASAAIPLLAWSPAMAQDAGSPNEASSRSGNGSGEIIVTARKRNETAIDVPAAITALGAADLERYNTRDFWGLQNQVPGLVIQDIPSSSGGAIALRGISSSPNNPAADQTVAINTMASRSARARSFASARSTSSRSKC